MAITAYDSKRREVFSLTERSEVILAIANSYFIREQVRRGRKVSHYSEWSRCSEPNCQLLACFGNHCSGHERIGDPECVGSAPEAQPGPEARLADVPIEDLDLSVGVFSRLKSFQITMLGQLVGLPEEEIADRFDRVSLNEIKDKLVQRGFVMPEELTEVLDRRGT